MNSRALILICMTFFAPTLSVAAEEIMKVEDVEMLNDNLSKYSGRRIQVEGKVEENIDNKSFVLSGGGLINDEIVVVSSPEDPTDLNTLSKNTRLMVTGTLILKPQTGVTKQSVWSLSPQLSTGFQNVKAYLIADEINRRE